MQFILNTVIQFFLAAFVGFAVACAGAPPWIITVNDSTITEISSIDDPHFLYDYYIYQKEQQRYREAMLAAYQYIYRFSDADLAPWFENELLDMWQKSGTPEQVRRQIVHFRKHFLPRLEEPIQKEWLAHYYLYTNQLDSLRNLDQYNNSETIRLCRIYGEADAEEWETVKTLLHTLSVSDDIRNTAVNNIEDYLKNNHHKMSSIAKIIPGYQAYAENLFSTGNWQLLGFFSLTGTLVYYTVYVISEPYLIIPYLLVNEVVTVFQNHGAGQSIMKPELRLLVTEKDLLKNRNNFETSLDNQY